MEISLRALYQYSPSFSRQTRDQGQCVFLADLVQMEIGVSVPRAVVLEMLWVEGQV